MLTKEIPVGTVHIKDHKDYIRDLNTGAITFNNHLKVNKYKEQLQVESYRDMEIKMLKEDIKNIKNIISQLLVEIKQ
jgi:hypothetical protein